MSAEPVTRSTTDPGVIHRPSSSRTWWTTGNVAEAVPGVLTPLTYTFWTGPFERSVRGSYAEMGVISRAQGRKVTDDPDDTALGIVFGRAVLNVNLILSVGAGLPGTNAAEVAANILGDTADNITALPRTPQCAIPLCWPGVTNVRTGTALIRNGDTIRVDGSRGTVTRVSGAPRMVGK